MRKEFYTTDEEIQALRDEMKEARKKSKYKSKKSKYVKIISNTMFGLVVVFLTSTLFLVDKVKSTGEVPNVFGYQLYQVETGSMIPTLDVGSIIISKEPKSPESLEVGDIVTFDSGETIITHRIIEIIKEDNEIKYRTKGDNPVNTPDLELLEPENIKGKFVVKVPFS